MKKALRPKTLIIFFTLIILLSPTLYILYIFVSFNSTGAYTSEQLSSVISSYTTTNQTQTGVNTANRLIIPKLGTDLSILSGEAEVLEKGIWHRSASNPVTGGNIVLSGHRFRMGVTLDQLQKRSPLFHIDKLDIGDEIIIIWDKTAYTYIVTEIKKVNPDQNEIENQSETHRITLYTCTLEGSLDGRDVIIAIPK